MQGDANKLAYIQTTSWKSAFKNIITDDDLERLTNLDKATAMYTRLINENKGNGYIGEIDGKPHCIAYWDKARDTKMCQYAEIICIHSLPDNWRKGFGSKMMDTVLADILNAGFSSVNIQTAMIVCKAFHARRCLMLYQLAFPNVDFIVCPIYCYNITAENWFKSEYGIDRVLGELSRCGNQFITDIKSYLL